MPTPGGGAILFPLPPGGGGRKPPGAPTPPVRLLADRDDVDDSPSPFFCVSEIDEYLI